MLSVSVLLVLIIAAAGAVFFWPGKKPEPEITPAPATTAVMPIAVPTAPVVPADVTNDFKIGKISLQKTKGTGLVYAVGTVKNTLDHQRFGVRIELNLLDEQDQNIGIVSDYTPVIEAHKDWQFRALLTEPKAVKATLADIKEQP